MTAPVGPEDATPARPKRLPRWRRILVATLVVVSVVLAPIALLSVFVRNQLLDTDSYLDTVGPLASDPAIVQVASDRLTTRLFAAVDVEERAKDALPDRAAFLAGPLTEGLEQVTREAAVRLLESDQFQTIWRVANRKAHGAVREALTGDGSRIKDGKVVLDLRPLVVEVRKRLDDRGVTFFDNVPTRRLQLQYELFDASQIESARSAVKLIDKLRVVLVALVFLFLAAALALSGNRRRTLIRWGIGITIAMAFTAVVMALSRNAYLSAVSSEEQSQSAAAASFDTILRFVRNGIRLLAALGIIVAIGAFLSGPSRPAVRLRTGARRLVTGGKQAGDPDWRPNAFGIWVAAHKVALRWAGLAVAVLVLITWDRPRPLTLLFLAILLLVYLGVIEFLGRGAESVTASDGSSGTGS